MMICSQHTQKVSFVLFCFFYRLITNCCIFFLSRKIKLINSPLIFFTTSLLVLLRCDDKFSLFFLFVFPYFKCCQIFFKFFSDFFILVNTIFRLDLINFVPFISTFVCLLCIVCVCGCVLKLNFDSIFFHSRKKNRILL